MNISFNCILCGHVIQEGTARINTGFCAQCAKLPLSCVRVRRLIASGLDPYEHVVQLYSSEVQRLSWDINGRFFGAIGDPMFESMRLYSCVSLGASFDLDSSDELKSEALDDIDHFLSEVSRVYSLFSPLMQILKGVAPSVNLRGGTVFLGSWGMGPAEIAWCVRYLNERSFFVRYLDACGVTEGDVDQYNLAYEAQLGDGGG